MHVVNSSNAVDQADGPLEKQAYFSSAKVNRCPTAGGNSRSTNGRIIPGSKQVINHIQTIIRNSNQSTNEADSFYDTKTSEIHGNIIKHANNNFFTTELLHKPSFNAIAGVARP